MASNPYVNKVQTADGSVIMDISSDTVTPGDVLNGVTFHDRSGATQQGSVITHNVYDDLDSTSPSDALSANQGRVLNSKIANSLVSYVDITDSTPVNVNSKSSQTVGKANFISAVSTEDGIMCLPYVNNGIMYVKLVNFSDLSAVTGNHTIRIMYRA